MFASGKSSNSLFRPVSLKCAQRILINNTINETEYLKTNAVVGLDIPTHPVIGNLLREGKLVEALRALQTTSPSSRVAQVAGALAKVVGDTKVEVKSILNDEAGNPVAGMFDPKKNTITLELDYFFECDLKRPHCVRQSEILLADCQHSTVAIFGRPRIAAQNR